jgi:hypothetical protein
MTRFSSPIAPRTSVELVVDIVDGSARSVIRIEDEERLIKIVLANDPAIGMDLLSVLSDVG